jgi:hypothetical protein
MRKQVALKQMKQTKQAKESNEMENVKLKPAPARQVETPPKPVQETKHLPAVAESNHPVSDGFDDADEAGARLIRGMIMKCTDGDWSDREGTDYPLGTQLLAMATAEALQHWHEQRVVETIPKVPGRPLPDVDELNAQIPEDEWETGLDGEPRKPWQRVFIVYLLDPKDASVFTLINSTVGMHICYDRLKDKVRWMRALRGEKVYPLVKLDNRPMTTAFGTKKRPELTILEWRDVSGPKPAIEQQPPQQIGKPVAPPTSKEIFNDEIPDTFDPEVPPHGH